ncbi:MAG TPA: toxin-antitoxin system HicB family antitoxin [Chthoniobacter sp.]|jgi:predicted HicB family RNase H-like nuclease
MKTRKPKNDHNYSLLVEWSDEDQVWIGRCPELLLGGVHGADRDEVYRELSEAVDEHIAIAEGDGTALPDALAGKEFSGKFVLRTSPEQHRLLALRALRDGLSLNGYVVKRLTGKATNA